VWVGTGESWMRNSVSVGTGVYKSTDAGGSWKLMGLEDSEHIARIAVDPKQSDTIYVCAAGHLWNANEQRGVFKTTDGGKTSKKTALYRSDDLGEHWRAVNDSFNVAVRPFYFARLVVDPSDFNRVYKPGLNLTYSTDGGGSFNAPIAGGGGTVHGDHHALWIN